MAASVKKKLYYSLFRNAYQQKHEPHRNQSIELLDKSIDEFPHDTSLYWKVFTNRLWWDMPKYKKANYY